MSYSDQFERWEQKQVDIHLAVDLNKATQLFPKVALISADTDFIPALYAAAQASPSTEITVIRPRCQGTYADHVLRSCGVRLVNL
jgi:uncharacterized LabA/DUF88 family protein